MVEIKCLVCGKPLKIPQYIDTEKYDGEMVCQDCEARVYVKFVKGKLQKYKVIEKTPRDITIKMGIPTPNYKKAGRKPDVPLEKEDGG